MAVSTLTRFVNTRNVMNVNNFGATSCALHIIQQLNVISNSYCTVVNSKSNMPSSNTLDQSKRISKAMQAYLRRSKDYKDFIEKQIAEYDIGKRHLANIMGEDLDNFTEKDISNAIRYLFPSGLYDPQARPMMVHPSKLYESKKEAEFDESGRPFHFLFYTIKPNYYELLHNIANSINALNKMEDTKILSQTLPTPEDKINLVGTAWILKEALEKKLIEQVSDSQYAYLITSMERLSDHPYSNNAKDFIMEYRTPVRQIIDNKTFPEPEHDSDGRPFVLVSDCMRKTTRGKVKVIGNGSGKITVNGNAITYFADIQCREQIIFPLLFTNMYDKVDVEAEVSGGGSSSQAGAIRWGISWALRSFVDGEIVEKMRLAGLLTRDWRKRERKKWGQEGARRKFTWNKR